MCKPLAPQPPLDRDEVVAFSSWVFNGEQDPRNNYTAPQNFDWDKITTWAPFEVDETGPDDDQYGEMFCTAHEHNARVLSWMRLPDGNSSRSACGDTEFYSWARARNGNTSSLLMFNQTAVLQWAQETAACIPTQGYDGIMLDQVWTILSFADPPSPSYWTLLLE